MKWIIACGLIIGLSGLALGQGTRPSKSFKGPKAVLDATPKDYRWTMKTHNEVRETRLNEWLNAQVSGSAFAATSTFTNMSIGDGKMLWILRSRDIYVVANVNHLYGRSQLFRIGEWQDRKVG